MSILGIFTLDKKQKKRCQTADFLFTLLTPPSCVSSLLQQVKLGSPDYIHCNTEEAIEDFMKRIKCYESSYQTLDEVLDR